MNTILEIIKELEDNHIKIKLTKLKINVVFSK